MPPLHGLLFRRRVHGFLGRERLQPAGEFGDFVGRKKRLAEIEHAEDVGGAEAKGASVAEAGMAPEGIGPGEHRCEQQKQRLLRRRFMCENG